VVDPSTALRLGIAFMLARRRVTRRFTYGLGRVEDFAGLVIIATILVSAFIACYEAFQRLIHPSPNPGAPA
jgi:Co/Zn/Cd efflux system component